uniref:DDE_3 domain-containing protein n=1 Tax=Caenorhabditis japonica TaxID=281687 RepID=A0A8R1I4I6_CAEJA
MDHHVYKDILESKILPHYKAMGRGITFQQDNDPKNTSKFVKDWFLSRRIRVMDWPSQSPDLNPIEKVWEELEKRMTGKRTRNVDENYQKLAEEWDKILQSVIDTLLDSMQRRCQAVIDTRDFATKYYGAARNKKGGHKCRNFPIFF